MYRTFPAIYVGMEYDGNVGGRDNVLKTWRRSWWKFFTWVLVATCDSVAGGEGWGSACSEGSTYKYFFDLLLITLAAPSFHIIFIIPPLGATMQ